MPLDAMWAALPLLSLSLAAAQGGSSPAEDFHRAMVERQYANALRIAEAEVGSNQANAEGWYHKGLAQHALHEEGPALDSLSHAASLAPSQLRYAQAAAQLSYQVHSAHALADVEAVLRIDPESAPAHGMAGVLLLEADRCADSSTHLLRPGVLPTLDDGTRLRLAACLQQAQPADATALLEPLRAAGRLSQPGYAVLGEALAASEDVPKAVEVLREACQRYPGVPATYADLAILSMDHQSPEVALGVLDAGIRALPGAAELYTLRGSVYAQLAQNEKASADFESADRLAPGEAYGALGMGMLLRDSSSLDEAQQRLEAKLRQLPDDPLLSYTLADVLIRQGAGPGDAAFGRAEKLLRDALHRDSNLPQAYALLGKLLLRRDDLPGATENLQKAVALNDHDRTALNQLVSAYRRAGRTADAARTSEQLARLADADRKRETDSNRIHLTLSPASPPAAGSPQ